MEEMVHDAALVVVAVPVASRAYWHNRRIVSDVTVRVTAVLSGNSVSNDIVVRLPGGIVGDVGQSIAGSPTLSLNTQVVLFLSAPRDGVRTVLSMAAGVFPMTLTPTGEVRVLPPQTDGITFISPPTASHNTSPPMPAQGESLQVFAARVRSVAR
jgi:hypothetical protein